MPKVYPTEYEEACVFVEWLDLRGIKFSHLAQETYTKSWGVKMRNKKQGVKRGVPDYLCIVNNHLVFIELKRKGHGVVSQEQQGWIDALNICKNTQAYVAKGANDAISIIEEILKIK